MAGPRDDPRNIDPGLPKALRRIYREIPSAECKGLCWESCQTVPAQQVEVEHAARVGTGHENPERAAHFCPYLSAEHRCGAYAARPLVCRLYGVVPEMRCPHGCAPRKMLASEKGSELVRRAMEFDPRLSGMDPELRARLEEAR